MRIDLKCGDCLELMKEIPNKSIDAVITDPPYGINLGNHVGGKETRKGLLIKQGGYDDTKESFDKVVVPAINLALRKSRRGMVFCVPPSMWKLPPPNAIGGIFVSSAVGRNKWGWSNLIHCLLYENAPDLQLGAKPTAISNNATAEKTGHPTTKPIEWLIWAIKLGTKEGDTVIDPFMGSGTTGVACVNLNRNFIGFEINPDYFAIAKKRINNALAKQGKANLIVSDTTQMSPLFASL